MLDLLSIATDGMLSSVAPPGEYVGPVPLQAASLGYLYPLFIPIPVPPTRKRIVGGGTSGKPSTYEKNEERVRYDLRIRTILSSLNGNPQDKDPVTKNYVYTDVNAQVKVLDIVKLDPSYDITVQELYNEILKPAVPVQGLVQSRVTKPRISDVLVSSKTGIGAIIKATVVTSTKPKK